MKKFPIFLLAAALLCCPVCKTKKPEIEPELASNDEALYQRGESFIDKDPEKGRLYFRQIIDSFPKSFYAQRAKLAIADSYFKANDEGSMIIAASEYREFTSLFPYSPSAAYAQFQIAMTFFKKILKPGRDQTKTEQALLEFRQVLTKFPTSEEAKLASEHIKECENRLAEHTFGIAEHYYKTKAYAASISRLMDILTKYPSYTKMDKVYYILADSYFQQKDLDQSLPYFRKLVTDFPQSKYIKKSQNKIQEIEKIQEKK